MGRPDYPAHFAGTDNEITWKNAYGALYNWYTVVDNRNLCPDDWHAPTDAELTILINYLGGEEEAGEYHDEYSCGTSCTPKVECTKYISNKRKRLFRSSKRLSRIQRWNFHRHGSWLCLLEF